MNSRALLAWHWPEIEVHPRIIFDRSATTEATVRWYLARGKPFTVICQPPESNN